MVLKFQMMKYTFIRIKCIQMFLFLKNIYLVIYMMIILILIVYL